MRTVSIDYDVYKYQELSEQAKEKAKECYLEGKDAYWFKDDCEEILHCEFPNSELKVEFSLSYSQGDGLNIYGDLDGQDIYDTFIKDSDKFTDKEKRYLTWAMKNYGLGYHMPQNYTRYSYCAERQWDFSADIISDMEWNNVRGIKHDVWEKYDNILKEYFSSLCGDYEKWGYEYFYEVDDETMIEESEANDWEYTADGKIF